MGFFIRKAFRFGPLRLNLSRSGVGISAGVTGARLGVDARGQPYVFGGRHGLYVRENLGPRLGRRGGGRPGDQVPSGGSGPVPLYEETGVTYPGEPRIPPPPDGDVRLRTSGEGALALALLVLGGMSWLLAEGPAAWLTGAGLLTLGGWSAASLLRRRRKEARAEELLARMARNGTWDPEAETTLRGWGAGGPGETPSWLRRRLEAAFQDACRTVAVGERIDSDELTLVHRLEALLGGDSPFTREARVDAFRGLAAALAADHELTREEEEILEQLREGLGIVPEDLAGELDVLARLRELRTIREGELPRVEPSIPLRQGETAHFEAEGRLLRERQLRRFQRNHVRYSVRGLTQEREGRLVITDRRVLLVDVGAYEIPVREILDLEVDLDRNLLRITRDRRVNAVLLTTPRASRAGAVLAAVAAM